jgi:hypothetical protein
MPESEVGKRSAQGIYDSLRQEQIPPDFFEEQGFNPFSHWQDDYELMMALRGRVADAVDQVIDSHNKGFSASTAIFSRILDLFTKAQSDLEKIEETLSPSKPGGIYSIASSSNRKILREFWFHSVVHSKAIKLLDKIEFISGLPGAVDFLLEKAQFLHAIRVLNLAFRLLKQDNLIDIPALADLERELLVKQNSLKEKLLEELHDLIYTQNIERFVVDVDSNEAGFLTPLTRSDSFSSRVGSKAGKNLRKAAGRPKDSSQQFRPLTFSPSPFGIPSLDASSKKDKIESVDMSVILAFETESESNAWKGTGSIYDPDKLYAYEESDKYNRNPYSDWELYQAVIVESLIKLMGLTGASNTIVRQIGPELKAILTRQTEKFKSEVHLTTGITSPIGESKDAHLKAQAEIFSQLVQKWFAICLQLLKKHSFIISVIRSRRMSELQSPPKKTSALTSPESGSELEEKKFQDNEYSQIVVWELVQRELAILMSDYFHHRRSSIVIQAALQDVHVGDTTGKVQFSFAASNMNSVAKKKTAKTAAAPKLKTSNWIQPSPYFVLYVQNSVNQFTDAATAVIFSDPELRREESSYSLRSFVSGFIKSSLIPRIFVDAMQTASDILNQNSAFSIRVRQLY